MNETLKKLSTEIAAEISAIVKAQPMQDFITKTKAASDDDAGTFEVVISTNNVDRQGESVDQNGWDLEHYKNNPVVLFGHDYYSLPVGVCDSIELVEGKLIAKGRFAPMDANPFAQQVRKLYDLKIMRATSVGFIVKEANGPLITKAELLEFSFVPVPANPYALSMRQVSELGIDLSMLSTKGLTLKTEEETTPPADPAPETPAADPAPETPAEETPAPEAPAADPAPETPAEETPAAEEKAEGDEDPAEDSDATKQIGAILATLSSSTDALIKDATLQILAIVQDPTKAVKTTIDSVGPEGTEGGEPKEDPATDPATIRSNTEGLHGGDVMETWLAQRAILRAIATATTDGLTAVNDRIRKGRV